MQEEPKVTLDELASIIGVSRDTIKEHIARLKRDQVVERVGGNRGGFWKVLDNE